MKRFFILSCLVLLTTFISCKKAPINFNDCFKLRHGIQTGSSEVVKNEINKISASLSGTTVKENVQKLAEMISMQCQVNATVVCIECIKTLPTQSEIRLTFSSGGNQYSKVIDIVSMNPIAFGGMHD
jgi:hypothetical protein